MTRRWNIKNRDPVNTQVISESALGSGTFDGYRFNYENHKPSGLSVMVRDLCLY